MACAKGLAFGQVEKESREALVNAFAEFFQQFDAQEAPFINAAAEDIWAMQEEYRFVLNSMKKELEANKREIAAKFGAAQKPPDLDSIERAMNEALAEIEDALKNLDLKVKEEQEGLFKGRELRKDLFPDKNETGEGSAEEQRAQKRWGKQPEQAQEAGPSDSFLSSFTKHRENRLIFPNVQQEVLAKRSLLISILRKHKELCRRYVPWKGSMADLQESEAIDRKDLQNWEELARRKLKQEAIGVSDGFVLACACGLVLLTCINPGGVALAVGHAAGVAAAEGVCSVYKKFLARES